MTAGIAALVQSIVNSGVLLYDSNILQLQARYSLASDGQKHFDGPVTKLGVP